VLVQSVEAANPSLKTGMDIKETQKIAVKSVKIENFTGNVFIKSVDTGETVQLSLKGPDDLLKQIIVKDDYGSNNQLYIAFEKSVPILEGKTKLILTIEMPATMPLDFSLVGGEAAIGVRKTNDTKINLNGFGDIKLASLKDVESRIDGSGEITIDKIEGNAAIAIRGDGKYTLQKGSIPHLKATIQGTGEINVWADVEDADLKSEGAGTMNLATVTGTLVQSSSGAGTIHISKIAGSVKHKIQGEGIVEMSCGKKK